MYTDRCEQLTAKIQEISFTKSKSNDILILIDYSHAIYQLKRKIVYWTHTFHYGNSSSRKVAQIKLRTTYLPNNTPTLELFKRKRKLES